MIRGLIILLLIFLAACSKGPGSGPTHVLTPVPVSMTPPEALLEKIAPAPELVFISPSSPEASSALAPEGERALRALLRAMSARISAWEAWAGK